MAYQKILCRRRSYWTEGQKPLLRGWLQLDGTRAPFVSAQVLIQQNTRFISKDVKSGQMGRYALF